MNLRCFNPQIFIGSRVGDVALESESGQSARSYDYRLEVLIDAVKVLAAAVPPDSLTPADQLALEQLKTLGWAPTVDRPFPRLPRLALRR
jgi:hypothetical protein